jgi:hypothetical protein
MGALMPTSINESCEILFNSPLEVGMRTLIVLAEVNDWCDVQRLTIYDYFLVHSSDISEGPESLHPASPYRSGELAVKREVIQKGLHLLMSKGLIESSFDDYGIRFKAKEVARPFLNYFESPYAKKARDIAAWIGVEFQQMSDEKLQTIVSEKIGRWGSEFINETLVEEEYKLR